MYEGVLNECDLVPDSNENEEEGDNAVHPAAAQVPSRWRTLNGSQFTFPTLQWPDTAIGCSCAHNSSRDVLGRGRVESEHSASGEYDRRV
jgi:hypothetical protein